MINSSYIHCKECDHYSPNEDYQPNKKNDGWCELGLRLNGKVLHKPCRVNEWDGKDCTDWVHNETGLTHFEVMTRTPEANRTPIEIECLSQFISWRKEGAYADSKSL